MNLHDIPDEFQHHAPDAEAGVIGGLLIGGAEAFDSVADVLTAGSFYNITNGLIYASIERLATEGASVDVVTVCERLRAAGTDIDVMTLHEFTQQYVGARVMRQHAELVADRSASRALVQAAEDVRAIAADVAVPLNDRLNQSQARLEKVQQAKTKMEPRKVEAFVVGFLDRLQDIADGKVQPGILTHFPLLDSMLGGGLKGGKQIIIAARPSVGKSSLAQQICLTLARDGVPSAVLSMEMGCAELTDRAVANLGRVRLDGIGNGKLDSDEYTRVAEAVEAMRDLPLFFDEQPALGLGDIVAKARALKRKHGLKVLAIDYLQLCAAGKQGDSRHHQIEEISRGLKALAKQLDITVITLSQLNREVEKRASGRPVLSDLKESGAIEEDADVVLMLWRHQMHDGSSVIGCAVPKNRQGRVGEFALHFEGQYQRWSESTASLAAPMKQNTGSRYGAGEY
jgi:replicative DNA helicase